MGATTAVLRTGMVTLLNAKKITVQRLEKIQDYFIGQLTAVHRSKSSVYTKLRKASKRKLSTFVVLLIHTFTDKHTYK